MIFKDKLGSKQTFFNTIKGLAILQLSSAPLSDFLMKIFFVKLLGWFRLIIEDYKIDGPQRQQAKHAKNQSSLVVSPVASSHVSL